jgi:molecular chaperone GrpE
MSNTPTNPHADPAAPADSEGLAPDVAAEPKPHHPDDIIASMRVEMSDLRDKFLRGQAEVENMRKRTEREKEETAKYAITKFARDIVGATDNFQRALSAVPEGAADQDPALKTLIEGVTMSEREFVNVMERHGIKRIEPVGELFNPHQHQAMMELDNAEVPAGTIVQVFQPGYLIEDRVLRPALVVVAKGGFKPVKMPAAPPPPAASNDDGSTGPNGDPSQGKMPAAGDERRRPGQDPVDTVVGEPRWPAQNEHITRSQRHSPFGITALRPTHVENRIVPQRYRHDRRRPILLVLVPMRTKLGARPVNIHETCLGFERASGDRLPKLEKRRRQRRPRTNCFRMCRLITIPAHLIRHPSKRTAIGHLDRKRLSCPRHSRREQRRRHNDRIDLPDQMALLIQFQKTLHMDCAWWQVSTLIMTGHSVAHSFLPGDDYTSGTAIAAGKTPTYITPSVSSSSRGLFRLT